jgi:predicted Fe-Mo cluster-binding NifX family protein
MSAVTHNAPVPLPNVRVAVATSTGERVDSHFSQSPFFDIYDIKEGAWKFAQRRANTFAKVAVFISDCQFVVANRIGSGAVGYLVDHGIRAAQFDDTVENALRALIASGKLTKLLRRQERK